MTSTVVQVEVGVAAPAERVWDALVNEIGVWFMPDQDGGDLKMRLEPRVGGRMFRDLGGDNGHLWGFVQVIKAPTLLEISGPMWRSAASLSHVQIRLTPDGGGTTVSLTHDAFNVPEEDIAHIEMGWATMLAKGLKAHVERN